MIAFTKLANIFKIPAFVLPYHKLSKTIHLNALLIRKGTKKAFYYKL